MTKKKAEPAPAGRPTEYTPALGEAICSALMEPKSLRKICEADDMPDKSTVCRWLARGDAGEQPYVEFRRLYEAAREVQGDAEQDEMRDIADEAGLTPEAIQKAKLRIGTRQWNAERLRPKKYGKKLELGGDVTVNGDLAARLLAGRQRARAAG